MRLRPMERYGTALLVCGIAASVVYVAANIAAALHFPGYSTVNQTVSELSAIGAPSRSLWLWMATAYGVLLIAFGIGLAMAARGRRALRRVGYFLIADGLIGFAWPPMHLRGTTTSLTDAGHIAFTAIGVPLMLAAMFFGSKVFGNRFKIYSYVSVGTMLAFGALTSVFGPRIPKDLPTPFAGVYERISIGAFLAWMAVLAISMLRERARYDARRSNGRSEMTAFLGTAPVPAAHV